MTDKYETFIDTSEDTDEEITYIVKLRKKRDGAKLDIHHITPSSRNGTDDETNLCVWDRKFHRTWHKLFTNLTLDEIHTFIDELHKPGTIWSRKKITDFRNQLTES